MILDDPLNPRGHLYHPAPSASTTSLSSFPPRPHLSDPYRSSYSSPHPSEPLLPYARHPANAFDRYPANLGAILAGRGKLRVLMVLAGASLMFLL